jgi:hypothetical protein
MPMPVSATAKVTHSRPSARAVTCHLACGVNFSAFRDEVRRICDSFLSSVIDLVTSTGFFERQDTDSDDRIGLNIPRSAENRSTISTTRAKSSRAPLVDLREIQQVVHHLGELRRGRLE